jgi:hypothetical protein
MKSQHKKAGGAATTFTLSIPCTIRSDGQLVLGTISGYPSLASNPGLRYDVRHAMELALDEWRKNNP